MKIRNKNTGQIFEVVAGTLYPSFFEEVKDDEIKIGEQKIEYVVEELREEPKKTVKKAKKTIKKTTKKGAKKNDNAK